ncbi:MAG: hypothetical protein ACYS5W_24360, partial [Planctomycetota bacterium]
MFCVASRAELLCYGMTDMNVARKCLVGVVLMCAVGVMSADAAGKGIPKLDNPMSEAYLAANLSKARPRLVYTPALVAKLKAKVASDRLAGNMYAALKLNARKVYDKPLLTRRMTGRRLLSVSREMLYRVNMLGCVYLVDRDKDALARLDRELVAVCSFPDWNPSHFLDVAEMS